MRRGGAPTTEGPPELEEIAGPLPDSSADLLPGSALDRFEVTGRIVVPFAQLVWLHSSFLALGEVLSR